VHAAASEPVFVGIGGTGVIPDMEFYEQILESDQKQLDAIVCSLKERGVNAESDLPEGPIVDSLITEIEDNGIELVVVGSHGHGAVFNIIAGSVTLALLHRAKVPVLVVPTKRPK
jgi:nucleotide-binding universal stress UspA family protein